MSIIFNYSIIVLFFQRNKEEIKVETFDFFTRFGCMVDKTESIETAGDCNVSRIKLVISLINLFQKVILKSNKIWGRGWCYIGLVFSASALSQCLIPDFRAKFLYWNTVKKKEKEEERSWRRSSEEPIFNINFI